ncbi:hypothetical protein [Christiangramia forsetii]|uniref:Secreted protein n=2 Tax=Christiangramia forsetii TaxID=411153 RepID=A0M1Z8_CHRFK|nr:hypothetical protein [Christiangramia forsetii]CAL66643.1 conserved hypothetical protein, secreted [Christiangramia forsetii KT0803]
MKNFKKILLSLLLGLFMLNVNSQNIKDNIEGWPETATKAAKAMMDKYGDPDEQTPSMLMWKDTGPFTHTIVYKEEIQHDFPMPHKDVLEQFINYNVPVEKYDDLAEFDGSVIVERTKGVMSARCDKEAANLLALNLANDVIEGNRSVEEARKFYGEAIMAMLEGNKKDYLKSLQFDVSQSNINNADETTMDMSKVKKLKKQMKEKNIN